MSNDSQDNDAHQNQAEIIGEDGCGWNVTVGPETLMMLTNIGLPPSAQEVIRNEACNVLSQCVPPTANAGQETGLVVGYVQSGKTLSFTTVSALARDNGFPIVIVIAGTSIPLTNQSHDRLRQDLQLDTRNDRQWRHFHNPRVDQQHHTRISDTLADWRDQHVPHHERRTILITVMKHHGHLDHLTQVLSQVEMEGMPVLIFDDEADQAGLNNLINEGDESTTYQRLCALKDAIPHHTFLQYTATPQGPLLINLIDVLSPDFAVTLTPGGDYVGGRDFFIENPDLILEIPVQEIPARNNVLNGPPDSLLSALRIFYLGVSSGIIRSGNEGNRSMMVHPSQTTLEHGEYFNWVESISNSWLELLSNPSDPDYQELVEEFRLSYDDLGATVHDLEPFDQLLERLHHAIRRTDFHLVNASRGRTPQVDWRGTYSNILIGGKALDRGFTVEGLTVTYMPRGVGARRADTIQQRARFFGYKRQFLGFCRVYLEQQVSNAFHRYVRHEEDVRSRLEEITNSGRPLNDLRRTFLLPRGLHPTRDSIIDIDFIRARVNNGWFAPKAPHVSHDAVENNREVIGEFVDASDFVDDDGHDDRTVTQQHLVAQDIPLNGVYENLLLNLTFAQLSDAQSFLGIRVVLGNYLRENPDALCTVYQMSSGEPRNRSLRSTGTIAALFQGANPVNPPERRGEIYPGDSGIKIDHQVSIQIHNLDLRQDGEITHPNVFNIAICIPDEISSDVLIQDQGGIEVTDE